MFPYTEKYTESDYDIEYINLLYKIHQNMPIYFRILEMFETKNTFYFYYLYNFHNSYFVVFVVFVSLGFLYFYIYLSTYIYIYVHHMLRRASRTFHADASPYDYRGYTDAHGKV